MTTDQAHRQIGSARLTTAPLSRATTSAAVAHANRPAIRLEDGTLITYAELRHRVDRLADRLKAACPARCTVALLVPHGVHAVVSLLATWQAGHVAVPLSGSTVPSLQERLSHSAAACLLVDSHTQPLADSLDAACGLLDLDAPDDAGVGVGHAASEWADLPPEAAAIIYTSGSTGRPKGVLQTHSCLLRNALAHVDLLSITPADSGLWLARVSTISGITDMLRILLAGGCLLPLDIEQSGLSGLEACLTTQRPDLVHLLPTQFRRLARRASAAVACSSVRVLHLGGEPVTRQDFELYCRLCSPSCVLVNNLGCTEVPTFRQSQLQHDTQWAGELIPLFDAVDDREVVMRDATDTRAGRIGSIAVQSRHMALGYWRDAEQTRAAFHQLDDGRTEFRTGDAGLLDRNGKLTHLGRQDDQLRIMGQAVYPSVLADRLREHPHVAEVSVVAVPDASHGPRLVAFCVAEGNQLDVAGLRQFALWRIERWQIPDFVLLEQLPTLPGGKIDRQQLEQLAAIRLAANANPGGAPDHRDRTAWTSTERRLATIWRSTTGIRQVHPDSDFFADLGGDSLSAIDTMLGIEREFGRTPGIAALVRFPRLRDLATELDAGTDPRNPLPDADPLLEVLRQAEPGRPTALLVGSLPKGRPATSVLPNGWGIVWLKLPGLHNTGRGNAWRTLDDLIPPLARIIRAANLRPDVVVAFSFGGVAAWCLAHELAWQVPTILIEPPTPLRNQRQHYRPDLRERFREAKVEFRRWYRETGNLLRCRLFGRCDSRLLIWMRFRRQIARMRRTATLSGRHTRLLLVGSAWYLQRHEAAWRSLASESFQCWQSGTIRRHDAAFHPPHDSTLRRTMDAFMDDAPQSRPSPGDTA